MVNQLVGDFGGMLRQRQAQHLDSWISAAQASGSAQLRSYAAGLLKDYDAVLNRLTVTWSSGTVEGVGCIEIDQEGHVWSSELRSSPAPGTSRVLTRSITNFVPEAWADLMHF